MTKKMQYKIAIFGACAPYPRLIYISQGKKYEMLSKSGHCLSHIQCLNWLSVVKTISSGYNSSYKHEIRISDTGIGSEFKMEI